jgi:capsular exopolysaccharide synthesis family protein
MSLSQNINIQEENELKKITELISRNYKLFISGIVLALILAFIINRFTIPVFKIASSVLIKEDSKRSSETGVNDFLNSSLLRVDQNFQNELWVLKSTTVAEQTIKNLDLSVSYYHRKGFQYIDAYKEAPFRILYLKNHVQPLNVRFNITLIENDFFLIEAKSKNIKFYNFEKNLFTVKKGPWRLSKNGSFGELIETTDFSFIVEKDTSKVFEKSAHYYEFEFRDIPSLTDEFKDKIKFNNIGKASTVVEISLNNESVTKGVDIVNEIMQVYSDQNLDRKNHIARITIDYIEKQLSEISDSLSHTEDNLQRFRSSNQLLNINEQASGISAQYTDLQNKLAELITRKRYYDYVSGYLTKNDSFSNMIVPASMGIPDPLLNNLLTELIASQAQQSNLINNNQEKNPLVQKLGIQIENIKKTISENISATAKTTTISIDEMNKRIKSIENEISRLPATQRKLGNIERKYRLNDAIYNYMLEKRAEAKITTASNLPDNIIIEPANMVGIRPISPKKELNYLIALVLGIAVPFSYLMVKSTLNNKVETQDDIERLLTDVPILGKILHNKYKTQNVMFEFPKSNIAESYRALRTNLDFYVRGGQKKVIVVTSSIEGEGKSFVSMNIAMSYAQLGRRTILLDFDMRKRKVFFDEEAESKEGLSSYLINNVGLHDIIIKSPHENLDYIPAGVLPPNPTELMALVVTEKLIAHLKNEYDYIIIDTTPLAQVTDAYLLINFADVKVIVARYNYSIKKVCFLVLKDLKQKNIDHVCIVLNDNRYNRDQYGYGYGYKNKKEKRRRKFMIDKENAMLKAVARSKR